MLKIKDYTIPSDDVWECVIHGARNPLNSWDKSDSEFPEWPDETGWWDIGEKDLSLLKRLRHAGPDHGKFMRMLPVYADICAPLYWWKEFDTYKVGTVANSCSTMHTITKRKLTRNDFSIEHLDDFNPLSRDDAVNITVCNINGDLFMPSPDFIMDATIDTLNRYIDAYNNCTNQWFKRKIWYNIIQLLPSSFNQTRTVMMNYEVLRDIYHARKDHKLSEWHDFCDWIKRLPYAKELIIDEPD